MFIKNLVARMAGKIIKKKLNLKEGPVDTKKWWESKTVWSGIVAVAIAIYDSVGANLGSQLGWNLPGIPEWVYAILGAIGVYSRVTATRVIK